MTWINAALIACVVATLCLGFYLVWFIAHPNRPEQEQQESDEGAGSQGLEDPDDGRREEDPAGERR